MKKIDCFLLAEDQHITQLNVEELRNNQAYINKIYILSRDINFCIEGAETYYVDSFLSQNALMIIKENVATDYFMLLSGAARIRFRPFGLRRIFDIMSDINPGMVYTNFELESSSQSQLVQLNDYSEGSISDSFDFGVMVFIKSARLKELDPRTCDRIEKHGFYLLRLSIAQKDRIAHLKENTYTVISDNNDITILRDKFHVKELTLEKNRICTQYLQDIKAYLRPEYKTISFDRDNFEFEATILILHGTSIEDTAAMIDNALKQSLAAAFNVMIVSHSNDTMLQKQIRKYNSDYRLINLEVNETVRTEGYCLNLALTHERCGKFLVVLQPNAYFTATNMLEKIRNEFYAQNCATLINCSHLSELDEDVAYQLIKTQNNKNSELRTFDPSLNYAFYTPAARKFSFPVCNYASQYAMQLKLSRYYKTGYTSAFIKNKTNEHRAMTLLQAAQIDIYRAFEIEARKALYSSLNRNEKIQIYDV